MVLKNSYRLEQVTIDFDQLVYSIGSYHYNWHPEIELLWLLSGRIEANVGGEVYLLEENDLLLININKGHATFAMAPDSIAMRLHISPEFFLSQGVDVTKGEFFLNSSQQKIHAMYDVLRKDLAQLQLLGLNASATQLTMNATFYRLCEELLTFFQKSNTSTRTFMSGQKKKQLDEAIHYINENFRDELTLEQLANQCNYSSSHLSKLFKAELGINFYEYLTRCRLQHAVRSLTVSDKKIAEIALANGFSDVKAFNKMFKKHFGLTPSLYRNQVKPEIKDMDRRFKSELDSQQQTAIIDKLTQFQAAEAVIAVNPCTVCSLKEYEEKYTGLIENLQKIIIE